MRNEDLEKRLDEAKHEGRLDREATTLAVLAKLVRRVPADQRAELRAEIVRHAEATVAHHLRAVVRRLFQQEQA